MRSLLLIAHGSRRETANREIRQLTAQLAERLGGSFDHVGSCFLELADPDIPAAIDDAVANGANTIVILPYFLATGRHVAEDIPAIVGEKQAQYPDVHFHTAAYPGAAPEILDLLTALARSAPD
jgi:sirohydrochlorin ferrochelatase